jgi:hypothetical protein
MKKIKGLQKQRPVEEEPMGGCEQSKRRVAPAAQPQPLMNAETKPRGLISIKQTLPSCRINHQDSLPVEMLGCMIR